jgi:glyoxylase-like metal-dependent hydrolase (beta-lactamase superfamily II)
MMTKMMTTTRTMTNSGSGGFARLLKTPAPRRRFCLSIIPAENSDMRSVLALLITTTFVTTAVAQEPATPAPPSLVREGVTEKLTEHVWAIPDAKAPLVPNVGIVVGKKAVLVIETGMGARNAETILREVAKLAPGKPIYLVTTHVHPEHDLGAHAFPEGSQLIRSQDQITDIRNGAGTALIPVFTQRSELNQELLKDVQHRTADVIFDREYAVDLGGVQAEIYSMGLNHTLGDTAVLVDGVLFSGDVAMTLPPMFTNRNAEIAHWLESLELFEDMNPKIVVPSHGPFGDLKIVTGYREYLTRIRDRTAELKKAGKSEAEALEILSGELPEGWRDAFRLTGAIHAGYIAAE